MEGWKDSYARLVLQSQDREEISAGQEDLERLATAEALRKLHAMQSEKLAVISWNQPTKAPEYLIDDPEVRNFYGPNIGQIAHSHWWHVAQIEEEFCDYLGPLGGRTESRVDLMKVACLLRVADAMHLDRRRAPTFLRKLLNPQGVSENHWIFQERMAVPYIEREALVYSAAPPFGLEVAEAWWLAFDAISLVDRELGDVDHLLQRSRKYRLNANRVMGVSTPANLARYIQTEGWVPVDSTVRVSDVPKIVSTLGGRKLYGDTPIAALRELLQNAADAVDARRQLENRHASWGSITVCVVIRDDRWWLTVEDTGIGMSPTVLTGPLIDFGNSFWRSPLAAEEFPGIQASGFSSTGRYGIGFFSVFMLGSQVRVTSRRFDKAMQSVRILEFQNGLGSRPILFIPPPEQAPKDGGTRVEVRLDLDPNEIGGLLHSSAYAPGPRPLKYVLGSVAPNLGVRLLVRQLRGEDIVAEPNDWLKLSEGHLIARLSGSKPKGRKVARQKHSRLRLLTAPDGRVYGRAMIATEIFGSGGRGCLTVGGLRSSRLDCIYGVLIGREWNVTRKEAYPIVPPEVLADWASEQATLIEESDIDGEDKARAAQVVLFFGGHVGNLPVARFGGERHSLSSVSNLLSRIDAICCFYGSVTYDEDLDDVHPKEFSSSFLENSKILFIPDDMPGLSFSSDRRLLSIRHAMAKHSDLSQVVRSEICEAFGSDMVTHEEAVVGEVMGMEIVREVTRFERVL